MTTWETLDSRYLWKSQWYNLRQDRLRTPSGHEFTYTLVDHPGAVWVVPVTAGGRVALVWQYRHTVDDWCFELPAGGLGPDGNPEEVARLELLEEIGGSAADLRYVGRFYTSNGISNEVAMSTLLPASNWGRPTASPRN
jgi:ADP-ribose pyrophosphatase